MPSPLIPIGISLGGALLNSIFGSDDEFKMSDEQRTMFNKLLKESGQYQGLGSAEKAGILKQLRTQSTKGAERDIGRTTASLQRRGALRGGQLGGLAAKIKGEYGQGYQRSVGDIETASARLDREGRARKEGLAASLSGGRFVPGQGLPGLEGIGGNIMSLLNPQAQQQDGTQALLDLLMGGGNQSASNQFNSGFQFNPGGLDFRR